MGRPSNVSAPEAAEIVRVTGAKTRALGTHQQGSLVKFRGAAKRTPSVPRLVTSQGEGAWLS